MAEGSRAAAPADAQIGEDLEDLAAEIARQFRAPVTVIERGIDGVAALLARSGGEDGDSDASASPRTCVALFGAPADVRREVLEEAWAGLGPTGRMITCIRCTEADLLEGRFGLKQLKHLVRPFGRTRIRSEQPFSWLVAVNEKGVSVDRPMRRRIRVTVGLCRGPVLELGSGAGHLSAAIAAKGMEARGIELAAGKVATARALYPDIDFEEGDILALEGASGSYGTVILAEVLEHVPEDVGRRMTDIAWNHVGPGGRLIVSVPNEDLIPHRNHVREFTLASLGDELSRYGAPVAETRQPLRWLMMYVDKPA